MKFPYPDTIPTREYADKKYDLAKQTGQIVIGVNGDLCPLCKQSSRGYIETLWAYKHPRTNGYSATWYIWGSCKECYKERAERWQTYVYW